MTVLPCLHMLSVSALVILSSLCPLASFGKLGLGFPYIFTGLGLGEKVGLRASLLSYIVLFSSSQTRRPLAEEPSYLCSGFQVLADMDNCLVNSSRSPS